VNRLSPYSMKVITVSASRCRRSTSSLGKVGGLLVSSYARLLSTLSAETNERLRHPYAWLACMIGFASGLQSRPIRGYPLGAFRGLLTRDRAVRLSPGVRRPPYRFGLWAKPFDIGFVS
jgi:hypothetical protein